MLILTLTLVALVGATPANYCPPPATRAASSLSDANQVLQAAGPFSWGAEIEVPSTQIFDASAEVVLKGERFVIAHVKTSQGGNTVILRQKQGRYFMLAGDDKARRVNQFMNRVESLKTRQSRAFIYQFNRNPHAGIPGAYKIQNYRAVESSIRKKPRAPAAIQARSPVIAASLPRSVSAATAAPRTPVRSVSVAPSVSTLQYRAEENPCPMAGPTSAEKVLVFVDGFGNSRGSGVSEHLKRLARDHGINKVYYFSEPQEDAMRRCASYLSRMDYGGKFNSVIVGGYSFGGDAANRQVRELGKQNIRIAGSFLIARVSKKPFVNSDHVPQNLERSPLVISSGSLMPFESGLWSNTADQVHARNVSLRGASHTSAAFNRETGQSIGELMDTVPQTQSSYIWQRGKSYVPAVRLASYAKQSAGQASRRR